jgi:hypothetical protein
MFAAVSDWSEALLTSLAAAMAIFFAAIPKVLALLRRIRFNELSAKSGFGEFVKNVGVYTDPAGFLASVSKWFIRLIVLVVAFDALGLPAVSDVLRQLLLSLPLRGATASAGFKHPEPIANVGCDLAAKLLNKWYEEGRSQ